MPVASVTARRRMAPLVGWMDAIDWHAAGLTLLGVVLIGLALRDMLHTLFRPAGGGSLSDALTRLLWGVARHAAPKRLGGAGPFLLLGVVVMWAVMLVVGWGLIYLPHLPEDFLASPGLAPVDGSFGTALYVSLVTLATLGFGDFVPTAGLLRLIVPLEALVGFALVTAGISWILSIYPVLSRRRSLATETANLARAGRATGRPLPSGPPADAAAILRDLARAVVQSRNDFAQFPITYYFAASDPGTALPRSLRCLVQWSRAADDASAAPEVRFAACTLRASLEELADVLRQRHVPSSPGGVDDLIRAYAADHRLDVQADAEDPCGS